MPNILQLGANTQPRIDPSAFARQQGPPSLPAPQQDPALFLALIQMLQSQQDRESDQKFREDQLALQTRQVNEAIKGAQEERSGAALGRFEIRRVNRLRSFEESVKRGQRSKIRKLERSQRRGEDLVREEKRLFDRALTALNRGRDIPDRQQRMLRAVDAFTSRVQKLAEDVKDPRMMQSAMGVLIQSLASLSAVEDTNDPMRNIALGELDGLKPLMKRLGPDLARAEGLLEDQFLEENDATRRNFRTQAQRIMDEARDLFPGDIGGQERFASKKLGTVDLRPATGEMDAQLFQGNLSSLRNTAGIPGFIKAHSELPSPLDRFGRAIAGIPGAIGTAITGSPGLDLGEFRSQLSGPNQSALPSAGSPGAGLLPSRLLPSNAFRLLPNPKEETKEIPIVLPQPDLFGESFLNSLLNDQFGSF